MSFDETGYIAPRASEFLDTIQESITDDLDEAGLPSDIDFERDGVWGILTAIMGTLLGQVSEPTQAIYSQLDPNNATGIQLDSLGSVVGLSRNPATKGAVALSMTNSTAAATTVLAGSLAEGGGVDGKARWELRQDTAIPASTTVSATFDAETTGDISAAIGEITTIVTATDGWTAVNNLAAAIEGADLETDAEFRLRRQESLQVTGGRSINSLRANLLEVDGVQGAAVVDNDTSSATTFEGLSLAAHSTTAVIYPNTITNDQKAEVASTIYDQVSAGIFTNGANSATVTGADGFAKTIRWEYAAALAVSITVATVRDTGFDVADVEDGITEAITTYMSTLSIGDDVLHIKVLSAVASVDGVLGATVNINGNPTDLAVLISQISDLSSVSVS